MPVELLGKSAEELRELLVSLGEPAYRGPQIYRAIYTERRFDFAAMSNLPAALRARLAKEASITLPRVLRRFASVDGSIRYLLSIGGGNEKPAQIEAVFMPRDGRQTICISTQAGCAVDCHFCLTAQLGLIRNLTAGEIIGQVLELRWKKIVKICAPQTNIVLMGQGEPFAPTMTRRCPRCEFCFDPKGVGLAPHHASTLSTNAASFPGIERLGREKIRPLPCSDFLEDASKMTSTRDALMPINRKYPLASFAGCLPAISPDGPRDYVTMEYVLLGGVNDTPEDARRVVRLLSHFRTKVNLIPWNPGNLPYRAPTPESIEAFKNVLIEKGVPAFVRYSRGQDVFAACGQLALIESASPLVGLQ